MFTYATPTFITKAFYLVTQVQLLLMNATVNKFLIQCQLSLIGLISTTRINAKAMPINNTDYNCHTTAVEPFNQSYWVHITLLVINSLGGRHTHAHELCVVPLQSTINCYRYSFFVNAAFLWNSVPAHILNMNSIAPFHQSLYYYFCT